MRTAPRHRLARAALPLALATCLLVGPGAALAQAHNVLLTTTPAAGSTVAVLPDLIVLHYDLPAQKLGTVVVVRGPSGNVASGPPQLIDTDVDQPIRTGSPAGPYTVEWRVVSADGHIVQGSFAFTAGAPSTGTAAPLPSAVTAGGAATSGSSTPLVVAGIAGGVVVLALVAFALARGRRGRAGAGRPDEQDEPDEPDEPDSGPEGR